MLDIWVGEENDNLSFEDSDRFEEDSLCSWSSEPESVCNNWRGWKKPTLNSSSLFGPSKKSIDVLVSSLQSGEKIKKKTVTEDEPPFLYGERVAPLCELAARCVASHIPFELVEHVYPPVPEQLQLRIAYWSFPSNEEDIRLYSCLANSSADEFQRGEHLYRSRAVKEPLQIGFHLSASVSASISTYNVAVTFDRRRITSCNCTCNSTAYWCSHIVAVCLYRIHQPMQVTLRAPVSESLSRLQRDQLQKFAQYLISELPQQILPTAQRLLDELLSSQPSAINSVCGAPDPTAGASANEQTSWYLDEKTLHDNIKKILIKFCVPAPIVFSDVNYLSNTAPPAASEWTSLLRPLRGREPEGMWNLLSIVREMFKRNDRNALPLLEIITDECMACEQILVWWFYTKVALHAGYSGGGGNKHSSVNSNSQASQHACSSLCDEVVILWRLAALNPSISPSQRSLLQQQFTQWHLKVIDKVTKREGLGSTPRSGHGNPNKINPLEVFSGFKPAVEACFLDWGDFPLPGITYSPCAPWLYQSQPFPFFRHNENQSPRAEINPVNSSQAVINMEHSRGSHHHYQYCHGVHGHAHHSTSGSSKRMVRNTSGTARADRHNQMYRLNLLSFMSHSQRAQQFVAIPASSSSAGANGNHSSVSSEGFCDGDLAAASRPPDREDETDSQGGGGSDTSWSSGREAEVEVEVEGKFEVDSEGKFRNSFSLEDSDCSPPDPSLPHQSPPRRRLSQDDSLSSSNSDWQQSGDEFNVYYYDPKALEPRPEEFPLEAGGDKEKDDGESPLTKVSVAETAQSILQSVQGLEDPWDILLARSEGLYVHGHVREACMLGVRLAEEMLNQPPDLMVDIPPIQAKGKRKKVNPASHQLSVLASNTLAKCGYLCHVLAENPEHFHLAFRVGLFGLEMARPPASTKPIEVKLANQESELVTLLKRIPLGERELATIRERAQQLRDGCFKSRGEALLPMNLAGFLLDALINTSANRECRCQLIDPNLRLPTDEKLGFEAAVAALGLKANVSEADHPLLCEGTRRQRGDLAICLLVLYKDDPVKLARIMDKLLDRDVHQLIKAPVPSSYYSSNPPVKSSFLPASRPLPRHAPDVPPVVQSSAHPPPEMQHDINGAGSRPQSGTSAEMEGIANLSLGSPGPSHVTPPLATSQPSAARPKESVSSSRFKGKRQYPSIPNQPSEAGAHFTFELAKTVLMKAGGSSSTSLFTQASTSQNHHGPHRALHTCAFQLGLYALGLHNCVSPNWLSRTYSSHVSWITGQAMEIGAPAITFLMDTWEGHLTPPEAVSIADRASRGCDPNMVAAAAQLALSCLPHAHALNPNEIQRAILQCKEQSDVMLEHSCLTVENAAKGGGVYPEVLFQVAKYWYELYMRHSSGNGEMYMENEVHIAGDEMNQAAAAAAILSNEVMMEAAPPVSQPPPTAYPAPPIATIPYTIAPFGFTVQPLPHFQLARHPHLPPPAVYHLSPPTFQYPPHAANNQPAYASVQPTGLQYYGVRSHGPVPHHVFPIAATMQPATIAQAQIVLTQAPSTQCVTQAVSSPHSHPHAHQHPHPLPLVRPQPQHQGHRPSQQYSQNQLRCLLSAYRVGMLALDTLSRRVHDDRPQAKYARNPPYGEDVKWLLRVSKKLGTQYLHQLCVCAVNSVVSPFVLHDMALEAAHYLSPENHYCNNPGLVMQHLRTTLTPLVHKCQQMYIQCMHQKLYHLTSTDYDDFVNIVCSARAAFQITPEGNAQFKEWLQSIRRSKSCKKDLWAQINVALQANSK